MGGLRCVIMSLDRQKDIVTVNGSLCFCSLLNILHSFSNCMLTHGLPALALCDTRVVSMRLVVSYNMNLS